MLLIRGHKRARCQAEIPLTAPSEIVEPPLGDRQNKMSTSLNFKSAHDRVFDKVLKARRQWPAFKEISVYPFEDQVIFLPQ